MTSTLTFAPTRAFLAATLLAAFSSFGIAATPKTTAGSDAAAAWCDPRCDEIVPQWNLAAWRSLHAHDGYADPMAASRILAMVHLAMHDAVNAVQPRYQGYASSATVAGADPAVAAIVAAHDVLAGVFPAQKEVLRSQLAAALLDAGVGPAVEAGKKAGSLAAAAVLAKRAQDGSTGSEPFAEGTTAGQYRYVAPFNFMAAPHWRKVQPFALRTPEQFRVAPPPALTSREYVEAFNEVKAAGPQQGATRRTADQAQYAAFWYEFSDTGWNRIARAVSAQRKQNLWDRARTFALLNVVMADAYIAGWDSKMHYNFWRPTTAIQMAADDGNPQTQPDAKWTSMLPTPPVQDHPSTHSALGASAAVVLAHAFGSDRIPFRFSSPSAPPEQPSRKFTSFSQAAEENADSRVRAGLHFRFATVEGLKLGRQIGNWAVSNMLAPAR
jgi:hypothetical protein